MDKVLITGGTGFVGANLVRKLVNEGYDVYVIHRKSSNMWRLEDIKKTFTSIVCDLMERDSLFKIIETIKPDFIIHLAIYGGLPGQKDEHITMDTNLKGTINLVEALESIDYKCFINTGSSSEYGPKNCPMSEDLVCNPINIYGVAKLAATNYCNYVARIKNRCIGTLRLFSPFGDFEEKGRLIPHLITNIIDGNDVKLANPKAVRDFIYIDDVIDLYLKILANPEKLKGEVFNVGLGTQECIEYIAKTVKNIEESPSNLVFGALDGRCSDTEMWFSDNKKVKETFNWKPQFTIEDGLKKSIKWFRDNIHLYR